MALLLVFFYWRSSSSAKNESKKGTFKSAGQTLDSAIEESKDKVNEGVQAVKGKMVNAMSGAKEKLKKGAEAVENAANDVKKKL